MASEERRCFGDGYRSPRLLRVEAGAVLTNWNVAFLDNELQVLDTSTFLQTFFAWKSVPSVPGVMRKSQTFRARKSPFEPMLRFCVGLHSKMPWPVFCSTFLFLKSDCVTLAFFSGDGGKLRRTIPG